MLPEVTSESDADLGRLAVTWIRGAHHHHIVAGEELSKRPEGQCLNPCAHINPYWRVLAIGPFQAIHSEGCPRLEATQLGLLADVV